MPALEHDPECPVGGCPGRPHLHLPMCYAHWRLTPPELQFAWTDARQKGQPVRVARVVRAAVNLVETVEELEDEYWAAVIPLGWRKWPRVGRECVCRTCGVVFGILNEIDMWDPDPGDCPGPYRWRRGPRAANGKRYDEA